MADKEQKLDLHFVEKRLSKLSLLKGELTGKIRRWLLEYRGQRIQPKNPDKSDYKTNTGFSIVNAKASELLSGLQEYDFIPLSEKSAKYQPLVKRVWEYEWLRTKTDKELGKVISNSLITGDGFMYEGIRRIKRKIKVPTLTEDGGISWKEEEKIDYDGIYCEYIPWENFFIDSYDIGTANEAIWIKHWDRFDFIRSFEFNPNYKGVTDKNIPKNILYTIADTGVFDKKLLAKEREEVITEIRYYNKSKDQFLVLANGVEVCNMGIPYKHKELPFCRFSDYPLFDREYAMGEYELLEEDILYKDALRSLNIDAIKVQMGLMVVDPDADFDEGTIEIGPNKFARINPRDISHFAPNINVSSIIQAEQAVDNDMIIKSGIDFRSQILGAAETATKTQAKQQSARKRINLNLKLNGYTFFERLAYLRMSNISLLYSGGKKIPNKGGDIINGEFIPSSKGYGMFDVKGEYVEGEYKIVPITDSILGVSTEREKNNVLAFAQVVGGMVREDGTPVINVDRLAEKISEKFGIDITELQEGSEVFDSPEDIMNELDNMEQGIPTDPRDELSPNYIPPEQRSGNSRAVPTIGGGLTGE